jgi:anti-sigma regulatory factor (Ser/Thr protein kinase)
VTVTVSRSFPPEATSVPAARRFVRGLLLEAGQERWVDEAQLAVSELCTNAVLHAHTAFEVTVQCSDDGVYVQVWDDDAVLPTRRFSDAGSTTGRGMELVEAVASSSGVQTVGPTKVVWFCLGMSRPDGDDDVLLDRWRYRADESPAVPDGAARDVVLLDMPVALWVSAREHHNTLMREFSLHQQAAQVAPGLVPARLVAADRCRSLVLVALRAAGGGPAVELHLQVRPEQAAWFEALRDVLDDAEQLARTGALLASPGPSEIVAVRRWACGQVLHQLAGGAPSAWTGPLELLSAPALPPAARR